MVNCSCLYWTAGVGGSTKDRLITGDAGVTTAWVEGVWEVARTGLATDLVVVVDVERVASTWEVVKLLLLTGLATVEDREL